MDAQLAQIPSEKLRKVSRLKEATTVNRKMNKRAVALVRLLVGYQYYHVTYSHIISSMNLWLSDESESHILNPVL